MGADAAVADYDDAGADQDERPNTAAKTDLGPGLNDRVSTDLSQRIDPRFRVDKRGRMNARMLRRHGMKQRNNTRPFLIGRGCDDCYGATGTRACICGCTMTAPAIVCSSAAA